MSAPVMLADQRDRDIAAREFGVNLVVSAGAGTGKTALLVERALNLLGGGVTSIDRLAAVTFTEKAAADLRERLAAGLDGLRRHAAARTPAAGLPPAREADRSWVALCGAGEDADRVGRRALDALQGLDGAAIGTLHALCADILRRYPAEAGVDPRFTVDEGPAAERLFPRDVARFLRAELGAGGARLEVWRRALGRRDDIDTVLGLGSALTDIPFSAGPAAADVARESLRSEVRDTLAALGAVRARDAIFPPTLTRILESSGTLLAAFMAGGLAALRSASAPMGLGEFARSITPSAGRKVGVEDRIAAEAAARRACDLLQLLSQVDEASMTALLEAAAPLGVAAREGLLASGYVGFDGLLRLTADLLRRAPAVRRALSRRFDRLLVDEFQDTDPLQYEILFFLAEQEEGEPADDPYRTRLAPGHLFIVGDPKQSIYRFRGADMASFRRAVAHVEACGGRRLSLTASFRSPADLLAPVNLLFRGWLGGEDGWRGDYEPPYEDIVAARHSPPADAPRLEIWSVVAGGDAAARRRAEAEAIAGWVARHASPGSGLDFRQVAILMRSLTDASLFAAALRRAGIPSVVDGGREFGSRPEVGDLLSFLRAVASPNDGPALLAVLRSPLGAVDDAELARFAVAGGRLDRDTGTSPDAARFPGVARVFDLIDGFRARMRRRPVDRVIAEALMAPPLALVHATTWDGAQRLANLAKLSALARRHAREGLSLTETIAALEKETGDTRAEGDSPLADETVEAVRILSVHKAKGLEYPVVFVPDLGRGPGRLSGDDEVAVAASPDGAGEPALRLPDGRCNLAWVRHALESRRHEEAEEKRILYVACTRARQRLILINSALRGRAPWRARLEALGYRIADGPAFPPPGRLAGGLVEHVVVRPSSLPRRDAAPPDLETLVDAAEAYDRVVTAAAGRSPLSWPSGTRFEDQPSSDEGTPIPATTAGAAAGAAVSAGIGDARLVGSIVHEALETWDRRDGETLLEGARRAAKAGAPAADVSGVTRSAEEILRGFLASPLVARLSHGEVLGREVPILHRDAEGTRWTGACDVILREAGIVVVADYKTDHLTPGAESAAGAAEAYRAQLEVYRRAVQAALPGEPVAAEVWFLRTGVAVRL